MLYSFLLKRKKVDVDILSIDYYESVEVVCHQLLPYDLILFTLHVSNADQIYRISAELKKIKPQVTISCGGHLATDASDKILADCGEMDCVMLGDGECVAYNMVLALEENRPMHEVESVVTRNFKGDKKIATIDVTKMLWPARDLLSLAKIKGNYSARLSTSRGCCGNCSFCSVNSINHKAGKSWQGRDALDIFAEIVAIYKQFNIRCFQICDGSFEDPGIIGNKRIEELCNLLIAYPVSFSFRCFFRAETFSKEDHELISLMRKAGFSIVYLGIESGCDADLKVYHKRATVHDNVNAIKIFQSSNITVLIGFIFFNPYSNEKSVKDNYHFLRENKCFRILHYINKIEVYYCTEIHKKLKNDNLLTSEFDYLHPYSYKFNNEKISELNEFLDREIRQSPIIALDMKLYEFLHLYTELETISPNINNEFDQEFSAIKDALSSELEKYFSFYDDLDITRARHQKDEFIARMLHIYQRFETMKFRYLKKSYIRELLGIL